MKGEPCATSSLILSLKASRPAPWRLGLPKFFFDFDENGRFFRDHVGSQCRDLAEAQVEARSTLPEVARHEVAGHEERREYSIHVRNELGTVMYIASLTFESRTVVEPAAEAGKTELSTSPARTES